MHVGFCANSLITREPGAPSGSSRGPQLPLIASLLCRTRRHPITFNDVRFQYRTDQPILQGLSVHIPAGTSCAFVGTSGSGKSTVLKLLFRLYDVTGGGISIGG